MNLRTQIFLSLLLLAAFGAFCLYMDKMDELQTKHIMLVQEQCEYPLRKEIELGLMHLVVRVSCDSVKDLNGKQPNPPTPKK